MRTVKSLHISDLRYQVGGLARQVDRRDLAERDQITHGGAEMAMGEPLDLASAGGVDFQENGPLSANDLDVAGLRGAEDIPGGNNSRNSGNRSLTAALTACGSAPANA